MTRLRVIQGGPERRKRRLPVDVQSMLAPAAIVVLSLILAFGFAYWMGWL